MADDLRVRIDLKELTKLLDRSTDRPGVLAAATRGLGKGMLLVQRDIVANRISGQYLGVVTGTARKSIGTQVRTLRDRVQGFVGSPLGYVRAHELGFSGPVPVRAHSRTLRGNTHDVRAHERYVNMRARHFIRDSLRDKKDGVRLQVRDALQRYLGA